MLLFGAVIIRTMVRPKRQQSTADKRSAAMLDPRVAADRAGERVLRRPCYHCGQVFEAARAHQKHCKPSCRMAAFKLTYERLQVGRLRQIVVLGVRLPTLPVACTPVSATVTSPVTGRAKY